jgi:hypothetical protein
VVVLLAAALGGGTYLWQRQQRVAADREAEVALRDSKRFQEERKLPESMVAIGSGSDLLIGGTTIDDQNVAALDALLATWDNPALS